MTREFLKSLGIEDKAVIDSIMDENGKDINTEKSKYGDYDSLKASIAEANKQIENFKSMDIDGIKKAADDYKQKFEISQAESKKQLEEMQFNHALENALSGAKARNIKAVKALLETENIKLNKDGSLTGLTEQLDKLKVENDYLFEAEKSAEPVPHFLGNTGGNSSSADDRNAVRAVMGLPPV
jgi:hypothetical protein